MWAGWHEPHSEKNTWRLVVKVEIATAFCRNTTLIIISHVIKIITVGFMHNKPFPNVKMVLGRLPQSHFAPLWNVVTTVSVVTTLGDLVTIWFRGSKSCVMVAWRSPNRQKILLPCDEKSAWKSMQMQYFCSTKFRAKRGVFWVKNGGDFGGFCIYTLDDKWRI